MDNSEKINKDSISQIHDVEEKAKYLRENLQKEQDKLMLETKEKVSKLMAEAEEKAKIILENSNQQSNVEAEKLKKLKIAAAQKEAHKITSMKISKEKQKKIISSFINEIL